MNAIGAPGDNRIIHSNHPAYHERDKDGWRHCLSRLLRFLGSGPMSEKVEYEEFNKAEVDAYRGVLDDIAKEVGDRQKVVEIKDIRLVHLAYRRNSPFNYRLHNISPF